MSHNDDDSTRARVTRPHRRGAGLRRAARGLPRSDSGCGPPSHHRSGGRGEIRYTAASPGQRPDRAGPRATNVATVRPAPPSRGLLESPIGPVISWQVAGTRPSTPFASRPET